MLTKINNLPIRWNRRGRFVFVWGRSLREDETAILTDAPPRKNGPSFAESDRLNAIKLSPDDLLQKIASAIEAATNDF